MKSQISYESNNCIGNEERHKKQGKQTRQSSFDYKLDVGVKKERINQPIKNGLHYRGKANLGDSLNSEIMVKQEKSKIASLQSFDANHFQKEELLADKEII